MTELGSVNLAVRDIVAAERFYVDVLGLKVDVERSNGPSFVLLRAANCIIILQEARPQESDRRIELGFAVKDVDAIKNKLGDRAVVQRMGWGYAIETADPEGTCLNVYTLLPDRPAE